MKKVKQILNSIKDIESFFDEIGHPEFKGGVDLVASGKNMYLKKLGKKKVTGPKYTAKGNRRIIKGYATTPDLDWVRDSVSLKAIKDAQKQLLRQGTNTVFMNHDTDFAIGKVLKSKADKVGLFVEILISKAVDVESVWTKIKEGILSSFSIRFIVKGLVIEREDDGTVLSYTIAKMELLEVSVVGLPMNKEADITEVVGKSMKDVNNKKSKKGESKMKSEEKKQTITDAVKELLPELIAPVVKDAIAEALKAHKPADNGDDSDDGGNSEGDEKSLEKQIGEMAKGLKDLTDALKAKPADDEDVDDNDNDDDEEKDKKKDKKGVDVDEDVDEDDDTPPKKALKSTDDEATCKFVLYAMDNVDIYNKLTDNEKSKVKNLWFSMGKELKKW